MMGALSNQSSKGGDNMLLLTTNIVLAIVVICGFKAFQMQYQMIEFLGQEISELQKNKRDK
jgi:hypothetical protein